MWYTPLLEKNLLPDFLLRKAIRQLLKQRLLDEDKGSAEAQQTHLSQLITQLKSSPIAVNTADQQDAIVLTCAGRVRGRREVPV